MKLFAAFRSCLSVEQQLQIRQTWINCLIGTVTLRVIQVRSALWAQSLAIRATQRASCVSNQRFRTNERCEVEDTIIAQAEFGIFRRRVIIEFFKLNLSVMQCRFEAAITLAFYADMQFTANKDAFFRAA